MRMNADAGARMLTSTRKDVNSERRKEGPRQDGNSHRKFRVCGCNCGKSSREQHEGKRKLDARPHEVSQDTADIQESQRYGRGEINSECGWTLPKGARGTQCRCRFCGTGGSERHRPHCQHRVPSTPMTRAGNALCRFCVTFHRGRREQEQHEVVARQNANKSLWERLKERASLSPSVSVASTETNSAEKEAVAKERQTSAKLRRFLQIAQEEERRASSQQEHQPGAQSCDRSPCTTELG